MKKNVGKTDRLIRVVLGFGIVAYGISTHSWWGILGIAIIIPALIASDPLYTVLGIDTKKNS